MSRRLRVILGIAAPAVLVMLLATIGALAFSRHAPSTTGASSAIPGAAVSASPTPTAINSGSPTAGDAPTALDSAVAECEQTKLICGPSPDASEYPLSVPDPPSTPLLTESDLLAQEQWPADSTSAEEMTYAEARKAVPDLATDSSVVVDDSRVMWVATTYFDEPTPIDFGGYGPGNASSSATVTSVSVLVDAATGAEITMCQGCASLPRPHESQSAAPSSTS